MSMQESTSNPPSQAADESKALEDQSFVSSVLASVSLVESAFCNIELKIWSISAYSSYFLTCSLSQLPGVDPNDPAVKDLLAALQNQSEVCS